MTRAAPISSRTASARCRSARCRSGNTSPASATDDPDEIPRIELSRRFPTSGPRNRFGAILFIEKEGFKPLLDAARIAERFDIAIMSTKGMSVTAARQLIEEALRRP